MLPSFLGSVILQANDVTLYVEIFFIIILLIIFLALFASSIKIVREYERVVQFRLGRLTGSTDLPNGTLVKVKDIQGLRLIVERVES